MGKLARNFSQPMTNEQINELADNLDCGLRCFVHKEKKTILTIPDTINNPDSDSELWDKAKNEIKKDFDRYVEIEKMDTKESFRVMESFVDTVDDLQQKERFEEALRRPKPFANFKDEINNSGPYRQKWFDFKRQQMIEWVMEQTIRSRV